MGSEVKVGFNRVLAVTGVTRSQLIHLTDRGFIQADLDPADGPGFPRRFSFANLVEVVVARELSSLSIQGPIIKEILIGLRIIDDVPEPWPSNVERWRRFRNPATRPSGWTALLHIAPTPNDRFHAVVVVGEPREFTPPKLAPGHFMGIVLDLGNIIAMIEEKTGGSWEPVGHVDAMERAERAYEERRAVERAAEDAVRIDRLAAAQPRVALDRRLRADLGLPPRKYTGRWWNSTLLTEVDAERYRREHVAQQEPGQ